MAFVNYGLYLHYYLGDVPSASHNCVKKLDSLFDWPRLCKYFRLPYDTVTIEKRSSKQQILTNLAEAVTAVDSLREILIRQQKKASQIADIVDTLDDDMYLMHLEYFCESYHRINPMYIDPFFGLLTHVENGSLDQFSVNLKDASWLWNLSGKKKGTRPITDYIARKNTYVAMLTHYHKIMNYETYIPPKLTDVDRFGKMLFIASYFKRLDNLKLVKRRELEAAAKRRRIIPEEDIEDDD